MSTTTDSHPFGSPSVVCRGVQEICAFVGINPRRFAYYRDNLALPVFKTDQESKVWLATQVDLICWIEERKAVFFEKR